MKDMICAATVGMIDGQCVIDLNGYESSADGPVLQVCHWARALRETQAVP